MTYVDPAIRFIIAVLVSGLWQAPLFALAAWLVLRIRSNANATTRHWVFIAALFASMILPVATAAVSIKQVSGSVPLTSGTRLAQTPLEKPVDGRAGLRLHANDRPAAATPVLSVPSLSRMDLTLPHTIAIAIVALWLAGVSVVLIRLIGSLLYLERLKRDALPLPVAYRAQLPRWEAAEKGSRSVRLCRSDELAIPVAVGLCDAMILVPQSLLEQLEPHDVDSIVMHELAHLRRADDWFNAIERTVQALLFFNPAIHWLVAALDLEREVACDDWVLQQNDALPYATCLAKVVETTLWPHRRMTAPGAFVTRRAMSIRIERLLAKHRDVRVRTSFGPAGATVCVLAILGITAAFAAPSIAYSVVGEVPQTGAAGRSWTAPKAPTKPVADTLTAQVISAVAQAGNSTEVFAAATEPDYIDQLAKAGYTNLSIDELLAMKSVGVTAAFVRAVQHEGLGHPSLGELVQMRALGVDPKLLRMMRTRYGRSLSVGDIVGMKAVGVSPEYVDELSALGLSNLNAGQVRELRALDVTPGYVHDLGRAGYPNLSFDQIEQLKALGIDSAFISRAAAHGFHHLSIEQLVRLKTTDVM